MTRYHERDRVRAARTSHGAHRGRSADRARELGISPSLPARYGAQRFPHAPLEYRSPDVQRQAGKGVVTGKEGEHRTFQRTQGDRVLDELGSAELVVQQARKLLVVVAKLYRTQIG